MADVGAHPVLEGIVGQRKARSLLTGLADMPVHALLFAGPPGSGKREAARLFAAALVCPNGGCGTCDACRAVLEGRHPDVVVVEREGAHLRVEEAIDIVQLAQRTPRVADRQVLILTDFHLVDRAGPALLKTIEETADTTVIIVLSDSKTRTLDTIASRCLEVEFVPLDIETITEALVAGGTPGDVALAAAAAANGRIDRARLLVDDPGFVEREARWRSVPDRLDGTGATVATMARELANASEELLAVLREHQEEELESADNAAELAGLRRLPNRKAILDRHKREQRRVRTDELLAGLATLASAYRSRLDAEQSSSRRIASLVAACQMIDEAALRLQRNVSETLLLEALFLRLEQSG